jgi:hypothetical protein
MRSTFVLAALCGPLLAGCGGGGDVVYQPGPPVVVLEQASVTTGDASGSPNGTVATTIDGPAFTISKPAGVEICVSGAWVQSVSKPVSLTLRYTALQPVPDGAPTLTATTADAAHAGSVPIEHCINTLLSAGTYPLQALMQLSADCPCGDTLRAYTATVKWTVRAQYEDLPL